jgi:plastocyanin
MHGFLSRLLVAGLVVASFSVGNTAYGATAAHRSTPAAGMQTIVILDDAYHPAKIRVQPGEKIAVDNQEGEDHSLTAKDGSFDTGIYESGIRYITAPLKPGRYPYSCLVHGPKVMQGIIAVEG